MFDGMEDEGNAAAETVRWWYYRATEQDDADAQYMLGVMYADGEGVPQDDAEAVRWWRQAADRGHVRAQFYLGMMYGKGRGVKQDYVQAHKWLNLSASRFSRTERKWRDKALQARNKVASLMTRPQIVKAQRLARSW